MKKLTGIIYNDTGFYRETKLILICYGNEIAQIIMGTRDHCWSSHHVKSPTAPGVIKPVQNVSSSFNERNCTVITIPHSLPVQNLLLTWNVISLFSLNEICLNELSLLDFFIY